MDDAVQEGLSRHVLGGKGGKRLQRAGPVGSRGSKERGGKDLRVRLR